MKKLLILSTLSLGALALTPGSAQAALLAIDDFDNGAIGGPTGVTLTGPAPQNFTQAVSAAGIIGGTRNIDWDFTVGNESRSSNLFINAANDTLSLSNGSGANTELQLDYGPGLGQTIVAGGNFVFPIVDTDTVTKSIQLSVNGSAYQSVTVGAAGSTVSFASSLFGSPTTLNQISFRIVGNNGFDVEIDQFGYDFDDPVVPEPMTILGTAFVLGALPKLKKAYGKKKAQ